MIWTSEDQEAYYVALEERCQYFEETITSAVGLLRTTLKEFDTPLLKPILSAIIERVHSIDVFLETALENAPNPDNFLLKEEL